MTSVEEEKEVATPPVKDVPIELDYGRPKPETAHPVWRVVFLLLLIHECLLILVVETAVDVPAEGSLVNSSLPWWIVYSFKWQESEIAYRLMYVLGALAVFGCHRRSRNCKAGPTVLYLYAVAAVPVLLVDMLANIALAFGPPLVFVDSLGGISIVRSFGWASFDLVPRLYLAAPVLLLGAMSLGAAWRRTLVDEGFPGQSSPR